MIIVSNTKYKHYQELIIRKRGLFRNKTIVYRKYDDWIFQYYCYNNMRQLGYYESSYILPYFSINIVDKSN